VIEGVVVVGLELVEALAEPMELVVVVVCWEGGLVK
jgi:hypothetical protein